MSDTTPKANRRRIIIPWVLFIVAVVGWSGYWMIGALQIGTRMDIQARALRAAGYDLSWKARSISGYPFRFYVKLGEARIAGPEGRSLYAPVLEAQTSALTPGVIVLMAPQGLSLTRAGKPPLAISGEVLRMSVAGLDGPLPRIAVEGRAVRLIPAAGDEITFSAIDRFEARLAQEEGDRARLFLRLDKATPAAQTALARIAGNASVTVGLEGVASGASRLSTGVRAGSLGDWLSGGGKLDVQAGGVALGERPLLSFKPSSLSADADGYLQGRLAFSTGRAGDAALALGDVAILPPDTAAVAAGVSAGQALFSGGGEIDVGLDFHDGRTWLGPVPLGPAPRLLSTRDR